MLKTLRGNFYNIIGKIIDYILIFLINIFEVIISIFSTIKYAIGLLFSMSGCLILFFIFYPPILFRFFYIFLFMIVATIIPFLGKVTISYLKYIHYIATEYFYDRRDFYLLGKNYGYNTFNEYAQAYRKKQEQTRQEQYYKSWEDLFSNFGNNTFTWTFTNSEEFEDFFKNMNQGTYQGYNNQYNDYTGTSNNYSLSFKQQYEAACDVLGVNYTADKYAIKLAYRKKAKEYHPDLNKTDSATQMFQKINAAYEFLDDNNIQRYKNLIN